MSPRGSAGGPQRGAWRGSASSAAGRAGGGPRAERARSAAGRGAGAAGRGRAPSPGFVPALAEARQPPPRNPRGRARQLRHGTSRREPYGRAQPGAVRRARVSLSPRPRALGRETRSAPIASDRVVPRCGTALLVGAARGAAEGLPQSRAAVRTWQ